MLSRSKIRFAAVACMFTDPGNAASTALGRSADVAVGRHRAGAKSDHGARCRAAQPRGQGRGSSGVAAREHGAAPSDRQGPLRARRPDLADGPVPAGPAGALAPGLRGHPDHVAGLAPPPHRPEVDVHRPSPSGPTAPRSPPVGPGEQQLGPPPDPGRARPPRLSDRPIHRVGNPARRRYRPRPATLRPDLAPVPKRPGPRHPRRRLPAPRHHLAQTPVRPCSHRARHPAPTPRRRHRPPHHQVDRPAGQEPHHDAGVPHALAAFPASGPGYEVRPIKEER